MRNVVLAVFDDESKTYQAFSDLKNDSVNSAYTIYQMAVVKKQDGVIVAKDSFDSGVDSTDDTWKGGLIGTVVGILGGPLGILLGGAAGALIGNAKDNRDVAKNSNLMLIVSDDLKEGQTGLVILVEEVNPDALDLRLKQYHVKIWRWDAQEIEQQVEQSQQLESDLRAEARRQMVRQKEQDAKDKFNEKKDELEGKISDALD